MKKITSVSILSQGKNFHRSFLISPCVNTPFFVGSCLFIPELKSPERFWAPKTFALQRVISVLEHFAILPHPKITEKSLLMQGLFDALIN
jgi:hypothetical protein